MSTEPTPRHGVRPELLEGVQLVALSDLGYFPGNARLHDDELLDESIDEHGQYAPIKVDRTTQPWTILGGNGTAEGALRRGWTHIAAIFVDPRDRAEAVKINLVDNAASDRAKNDPGALYGLLRELDGDLRGSGHTDDEQQRLLAELNTPLRFEPDDSGGVARLDRRSVTDCPACGHTFTPQTRSMLVEDDRG